MSDKILNTMKRNNKNIFRNTFRRHSNGMLYAVIIILVVLIAAGAIVMSNIESSKLEDAETTTTTQAPTTKKKVVEKKTEEATTEEETTEEETTSAGKLKVTTETINIRNKPSESGELIAQAEYDDVFEIIKKEGDWYKIDFNGTKGYVSAELVEEVK